MWPSTLRRISGPGTARAGIGQRGFSLLEIIVTLVLIATVGAMMVSFLGKQLSQGGGTTEWMRGEFELSTVMERIIADYREELSAETLDLAVFMAARDTADEVNALYGSAIDDVEEAATAFAADPAPSADFTESGTDPAVRKLTLVKGGQRLITIFTE